MLTYEPKNKRIGSYLLDAGLLTEAQIDVVLADQACTGHRFGDIVVARGWIPQVTLDYINDKVIEIERDIGEPLSRKIIAYAQDAA